MSGRLCRLSHLYRLPRFSRLPLVAIMLLVLLFMCSRAHGQLNFSTGWGKRGFTSSSATGSGSINAASGAAEQTNCKTSVDSLMVIYKLIQNEAQKLIECEKYNN